MELLNKLQADELFRREAILIGHDDVLPIPRAVELFGERAVSFAKDKEHKHWNWFGVGDFDLDFLNYTGFLAAISFYNVEQMKVR